MKRTANGLTRSFASSVLNAYPSRPFKLLYCVCMISIVASNKSGNTLPTSPPSLQTERL